jgi:hypothetical protein
LEAWWLGLWWRRALERGGRGLVGVVGKLLSFRVCFLIYFLFFVLNAFYFIFWPEGEPLHLHLHLHVCWLLLSTE